MSGLLRIAAFAVAALVAAWPGAASASWCDQFDPYARSRTARITVGPAEFVDADADEMRGFVETGSLGRVDVTVVSSNPRGIVQHLTAVPHVSRHSPHDGEELKGIEISVLLRSRTPRARIVLNVRQVCAERFLNTFLHY